MYSHMRSLFKTSFFVLVLSQAGAVGTQFLSIPPSAMDLIFFNTSWRNPAFLNQKGKAPELGLAYGTWVAGVQTFGFSWKSQIKNGSAGLDVRYVGLSDIELRPNKPTSKPLAHYAAYGMSSKGIYSWSRGSFQLGMGFQLVQVQLYQENSSGAAFDFGFGWNIRDEIRFNIYALNLGRMGKMITESPTLPQRIISSVTYEKFNYSLYGAMESNSLVEAPIAYVGGNGSYKNLLFGMTAMTSKGVNALSGGVGIQFGIYAVTYGFQWGDQHLGMPQMIDISIRLP
jgi:hypothetical protein